jgi:hypothetical protein
MSNSKLNKVQIGLAISVGLAMWNMMLPKLELVFGLEAKGLAVITIIMTAVGFIYKQFYLEDIFVTTKKRMVSYRNKLIKKANKK